MYAAAWAICEAGGNEGIAEKQLQSKNFQWRPLLGIERTSPVQALPRA